MQITGSQAIYDATTRIEMARRHFFSFWRHNTPKKLYNLLYTEIAMALRLTKVKNHPFMIKVEPTNLCNLRCPGCPTMGPGVLGSPDSNMSLSLFRKIVDEMGDYLYKISLYGWGEPLLNKDLYDMISYADTHNIGVVISSNGLALTVANAEKLLASGLEHLIVSIDGVTQEIYQKYRVGGKVDKVLENMRMLLEMRRKQHLRFPLVEWQFLLTKDNEHELVEARRMAADMGVNRFTVKSFFDETDGSLDGKLSGDAGEDSQPHRVIRRKRACYWLWGSADILHDGTVMPCCYKSTKPTMGNMAKDSFVSIWNREQYQADRALFRRDLKENPPDVTKECLNCSLFL